MELAKKTRFRARIAQLLTMRPSMALPVAARLLLCALLASCALPSNAASTDNAGNTMEILFSGSGNIATDGAGNQMFQAVSGPDFAQGLDSASNLAYPLSADQFAVPIAASLFSLE